MVIVVLDPVWKKIAAVVQSCLLVCLDWLDDNIWLCRRMVTPKMAHVNLIVVAAALIFGDFVRLRAVCRTTIFLYRFFAAAATVWARATRTASLWFFVQLRIGTYFRLSCCAGQWARILLLVSCDCGHCSFLAPKLVFIDGFVHSLSSGPGDLNDESNVGQCLLDSCVCYRFFRWVCSSPSGVL